jgi:hypothetical protein
MQLAVRGRDGRRTYVATGHCVFEYRYRDAANYKQHEDILLVGDVNPSDVEVIERAVGENGWFIPEQVGLPSLQRRFASFGAVDHVWHEFVVLRAAVDEDHALLTPNGDKDGLITTFRSIRQWEEGRSPIYRALATRLASTG